MNQPLDQRSPKYRFWLTVIALVMSGIFAFMGVGCFSLGQALAAAPENIDPDVTILTFNFIGSILLIMVPACLLLAYMLRPGGK